MLSQKLKKSICLLVFVVVIVLITAGCSAVDTLSSLKARFAGSEEPVAVTPEEELEGSEVDAELTGETKEIVLYFSDAEGKALVAEERTIPKVEGIARETIKELIKGPHPESGLKATLPEGTALKDINIRPDGLAIVDFSKELVSNFDGDSNSETLAVYSIVNTLTQFDTVKEVQILVDGEQVETINGHVNVFAPIARDDAIIK
ncbi:GerMN domain-containing protein [Zhaonella formicivorans]|jgi:spore germination protein GerM|uniref:GerMN domain-containing protein n=1 Tax=Zhaonella formicivorans TaxID=2528593 RepID=UPI0010E89400|nr:GerMN domain-containing protein [Zhaonella formicivorans]